jgi:serine-type D-Ala-D-Ala carboxypeptidase (penicillin-binding protein 5/6)
MRIVHPNLYKKGLEREHRKKARRFRKRLPYYVALLALAIGYIGMAFVNQPVFAVKKYDVLIAGEPTPLNWPEVGSVSIGYVGSGGALASKNGSAQVPTASTIKMLTALVLLDKKPLAIGEQGDKIRFDETDVALYSQILAGNGSVAPVEVDAEVTYRQALEAMLVGSSNNIAYKLATWGFGTIDAFNQSADLYALKLKLLHTKVNDPSGLSPNTLSSSDDMIRIADAAMSNPLIAQIVSQDRAEWPIKTTVLNTTNSLLSPTVVGVKTGNIVEAGYCYVQAVKKHLNDQDYVFLVSVFGQSDRAASFASAESVGTQIDQYMQMILVRAAGQKVAGYIAPWGAETIASTHTDFYSPRWKGSVVRSASKLVSVHSGKAGMSVGRFSTDSRSEEVFLSADLPKPSLWWRLAHAIDLFTREK